MFLILSLRAASDGKGAPPPQDRTPDLETLLAHVRRLTFKLKPFNPVETGKNTERSLIASNRERLLGRCTYKRKGRKVLPANVSLPDGVNPANIPLSTAPELPATGRKVPRGSHLTPERLATMNIGNGFLAPAEKQLFIDILFE
jgi:hypothetical protein